MNTLNSFLTNEEKQQVLQAIQEAESVTSGEIRVRIEKKVGSNPLDKAREIFELLEMRNTKLYNGVLLLIGIEDRQFVILGDNGINEKVAENFWDETKELVIQNFQKGLFTQGVVEGVKSVGKQLSEFFPCDKEDVNELPNAISYGE